MTRTRTTAAVMLLAAVVLVAVGAVLGLRYWSSGQTEPDSPTTVAAPRATAKVAAGPPPVVGRAPATPPPAARVEAPARVRMAGIELDVPLQPVGVTGDGQMELPDKPSVLGWYHFGPAPAEGTGSVVLAGHLDSREHGVGPLVRLRQTSVGDTVEVTTGSGAQVGYRVVRVDRYDQQALPDELFDRTGPERLRVITCGGAYDPETGYEENLVVTAVPR